MIRPQRQARQPAPLVAYVVRSFPRLSQTFVLDEMLRLEALGVDLGVFALGASGETIVHEDVARLRARVELVRCAAPAHHRQMAVNAPARFVSALLAAGRQRQHEHGYHAASRFRCFGQAVTIARRLAGVTRAGRTVHLHAHFAHDPALVAQLVHRLTGLPYTFAAHARDAHQVQPALLRARAAEAKAVVACSEATARVLRPHAPGKVVLLRHGVDTTCFTPAAPPTRAPGTPPVALAVGRLVEKKGFDDLLAAVSRIGSRGIDFRLEVHGDGPLRARLEERARSLGLAERVTFLGARTRAQLLEAYRAADVFALTPKATADGDVDGVPNVVLEAMASGLPVVATAAGGIPEAVTPEAEGLLAPPGDVEAIARHLERLLADVRLRRNLGAAARRRAVEQFDPWPTVRALQRLFGVPPGAAGDTDQDGLRATTTAM